MIDESLCPISIAIADPAIGCNDSGATMHRNDRRKWSGAGWPVEVAVERGCRGVVGRESDLLGLDRERLAGGEPAEAQQGGYPSDKARKPRHGKLHEPVNATCDEVPSLPVPVN